MSGRPPSLMWAASMNDILKNALAFAARGYAVLPLHGIAERDGKPRCTCGNAACRTAGKHPFAELAPNGKDSSSTDPSVIRSWFAEHAWLNYGLLTDELPTIDVDPRNGGDWRKLLGTTLPDIHTWRVVTGGGGQHIICGAGVEPIACGKLARGVDIKGVGGYIVGVGSLHESGKHYRWFPGCHPRDVELAAFPTWAREQLEKPKRGTSAPRTPAYFQAFLEPALPGERHEKVAALIGHLFGSAFPNRGVLLALVISHVRLVYPDLEGFGDDEIIEIARDLSAAQNKKREAAP